MGLPSGVQWSPVNVDDSQPNGFAKSPYQYEGSFFSWGNIVAHNPSSISEFEYDFGGSNAEPPYYEGQPYGETPGASISANLTTAQDAARAICGGSWRMPTSDDFNELLSNCDFIDASGNVIGDEVTNKLIQMPVPGGGGFVVGIRLRSRLNDATLFIAASGLGTRNLWSSRGTLGYLWSSSYSSAKACRRFYFSSSEVLPVGLSDRYSGFAIRPVVDFPS